MTTPQWSKEMTKWTDVKNALTAWSAEEIAEKRQAHAAKSARHTAMLLVAVCAECRWLATLDAERAATTAMQKQHAMTNEALADALELVASERAAREAAEREPARDGVIARSDNIGESEPDPGILHDKTRRSR